MAEKTKTVAVILGSTSDEKAVAGGINLLRIAAAQGRIDYVGSAICSDHRNPRELLELLERLSKEKVDVIITCAGKFAALLGSVDSKLRNYFRNATTRVVAVPLRGKTGQSSLAALAGVLEVPGQQLIFKPEFFEDPTAAFEDAIENDYPDAELTEQPPALWLTPEQSYERSRIKHPGIASYDTEIRMLEALGFYHLSTGKTREMFFNPAYPDLLYILATDRISIFDIVLETRVPYKGEVLTAMTVDRLTKLFADIPNHLVAFGRGIGGYLPPAFADSMYASLAEYLMRSMIVVKKCKPLKIEAIVRGNLTGSGWADYQKTGMVCGIKLPPGLVDGSELPKPLFTPSTKAPLGQHDANITFEQACAIVGPEIAAQIRDRSLELFKRAREEAKKVGIIIADTKFEFGLDGNGVLTLIDEVLTPDSSRFWPIDGLLAAMASGVSPPSFDKQETRDEGLKAGVKKGVPWIPPKELNDRTSGKYRDINELLVGKPLERYQHEDMGI